MKTTFAFFLLFVNIYSIAQNDNPSAPLDALSFGVVLDHPDRRKVTVKPDINFLKDAKGSLNLDIYSPPGLKANDKLPAIIFLNAIGDIQGEKKIKSWGIYTSWPQLMAANGFIGISMEADGSRIQESIRGIFKFIAEKGNEYNIDAGRLGIYAASANVTQSAVYLMKEDAFRGIKAAVLYYGNSPDGPFRKDLPVLFVISEGDVARNGYKNIWNEVLKNNAPWTIKMGTHMPHAFDAYSDNDEARKIVKETISFWKNNLEPVNAPSWAYSKGRDVLGSLQMDRPKALNLLKSLAEENPTDIPTLSFYADALRQSEKFEMAESVYKSILNYQPENMQALIAMAGLLYARNKATEAGEYVTKAANSPHMTRNLYAQLGFTLLVANKNKESAVYYEKALALEPRAIDYYNLACAYAKYNEKDKALAALENSLKYGYGSRQQFETDTDLDSLKSDNRFKNMVDKMK